MIEEGSTAFFLSPTASWISGVVEQWDGKIATVRSLDASSRETTKVSDQNIFIAREDIISEDVDDLLNLTVLHDSTLLNCLRRRFARDVIYTNIGAIVVAINPFKFDIPAYLDDKMLSYLEEGEIIERNLPHSWAVAHNTYFELRNDKCNQCVLVSGESGAGKTEASKIVMKYLAAVSCLLGDATKKDAGRTVGAKINLTSPALECFGNAKTVRNDNSSRFGKFMKVKFDSSGFLVGANIVKYLLEKSRIVTAAENERCYHSLYLVCRGQHAARFGTENDSEFKILTSGNCLHNKEFDTPQEYEQVNDAMNSIGISEAERESMWAIVAAVLHLGNVVFEENGEGSCVSSKCEFSLDTGAALLQVDAEALKREFTKTQLSVAGQQIVKVLKPTLATDAKEALMKALYDAQFQWLVTKCNAILDVEMECNWIGLLDIFGFEMFETNSFEQLCINLANESLQHHYNTYIFERDLDECRAEGIDMSMVAFPDNSPCIHMISGRGGVLALLDEECSLGKGSDLSFLEKVSSANQGNPFFQRKLLQKSSFTVVHYAGDVTYEVAGFLDKNRDTIKDAFKLLISESTNPLISSLLDPSAEMKKTTVGTFFKNQLKELMELLSSTNPHWIRCIKPHPSKKPGLFHGPNVMSQLSSSGVLGTVKIRKAGYPVRIKIADFIAKYNVLGKRVEDILTASGIAKDQGQKGTARVFLKSEAFMTLEHKKKHALMNHTRTIQAFGRSLFEMSILKQRQRLLNGALYERLRLGVRDLLRLQDEETSTRSTLQLSISRQRENLIANFEAKIKDIVRVIRQRQLEKQREEFERRQREEAVRVERERVSALRAEAAARRKREEADRVIELRRLHNQMESAREKQRRDEISQAAAVQQRMEEYFKQKSSEYLQQRSEKHANEQMKAEEVKRKRLDLESSRSHLAQLIAGRTEQLQRKGEALKALKEFETQQSREEQQLKKAMRRKEAAMKLQEEEGKRQTFLAVQTTISDARFAFLNALKSQMQKDNCIRNHGHYIERNEELLDMDTARELASKKKIPTFEKDVQIVKNLQQTLERQSAATSTKFLGAADVASPPKGTKPSVRVAVSNVVVPSTSLKIRSVQKHRDACRTIPIDYDLHSRLSGSTPGIIATYGTAAVPTQPTCLVPWKI